MGHVPFWPIKLGQAARPGPHVKAHPTTHDDMSSCAASPPCPLLCYRPCFSLGEARNLHFDFFSISPRTLDFQALL